jgi:hypothetical protein
MCCADAAAAVVVLLMCLFSTCDALLQCAGSVAYTSTAFHPDGLILITGW